MSEPVWERLRAADGRPLQIGRILGQRVAVRRVIDGDLPDHDAATVFDAWDEDGATVVRAASIRDHDVTAWELRADRLIIEGSDGRLEALLAWSGAIASDGELERLGVPAAGSAWMLPTVRSAPAGRPWMPSSARPASGSAPAMVADALRGWPPASNLSRPLAQITPRPPLVPVPISILAAFVDRD